jgi:hypothetical protein
MPRRPARVTQADIARALRAAKEAGANEVIVDNDGVIRIVLAGGTVRSRTDTSPLDPEWIPSKALQSYLKAAETR